MLAGVTPGNSAIDRAWELLALMLTVVAPSEGVAEVLDHWIRRNHQLEPKSDDGFQVRKPVGAELGVAVSSLLCCRTRVPISGPFFGQGQTYYCRGLLARIMHTGALTKTRVDVVSPHVCVSHRHLCGWHLVHA